MEDSSKLPGVEFTLQKWIDNSRYQDVIGKDNNPVIFTTDENGQIEISQVGYEFEYNQGYRLIETKAAEGYQLSKKDSEIPKVYFIYSNRNETDYPKMINGSDSYLDLSKQDYVKTITNQRYFTGIKLEKVWKKPDGTITGPAEDEVEISLYKKMPSEIKPLIRIAFDDANASWVAQDCRIRSNRTLVPLFSEHSLKFTGTADSGLAERSTVLGRTLVRT